MGVARGTRHCSPVMVGYQASRHVKEGLLRSFSECSRKPWVHSTCASDRRELLRVPLRSQGYCGVGRGLSGLHWVWCNGRGPHDKLRQETQGSSPGFECAGSDSDRRVPAELGQETQGSCCVEEWNSACLPSCSRGGRPLVELYVEPVGFSR